MYHVAAYYFPNYHSDPHNAARYGPGWNEWELLRRAQPRFPGHQQPKVPLWGYEDESDPAVFARKIDAAADHALNAFIFDWYWYNDGPFLQRALEHGFLHAPNNQRLQFALMWANHDWVELFPARKYESPLIHPGAVTRTTFETIVDHVISTYFTHPSYWRIEGRPYFSVYELYRLIAGLGGLEATRDALDYFRSRTRAAGFPDVHLNAVIWGVQLLPGEQSFTDPVHYVTQLGFDSVTSYVAIHHVPLERFPTTSYAPVAAKMRSYWDEAAARYPVPYIPNVTMGWDSSPRTLQDVSFENTGYPYMPILADNTPEAFEQALRDVREWVNRNPNSKRIVTINAWNEWTEGSYLEPDTIHGMAYLEAVRRTFG